VTARYTFAVCVKCSVQSPPIIIAENGHDSSEDLPLALSKMGWKFDARRFSVMATCPQCAVEAEAHAQG